MLNLLPYELNRIIITFLPFNLSFRLIPCLFIELKQHIRWLTYGNLTESAKIRLHLFTKKYNKRFYSLNKISFTYLPSQNDIYFNLPEFFIVFMEFHGWNSLRFSSGWYIYDYHTIKNFKLNNICRIGHRIRHYKSLYDNEIFILYCIDNKIYLKSSKEQAVNSYNKNNMNEISQNDFLNLLKDS
tara:strand:+ start:228 stop:782 length:555 start_codon:yes stop_codon:yes gene_type:complete